MHVHIVPILSDNFSYIVTDNTGSQAAVVDPAEPSKVLEALARLPSNPTVSHLLTTHHHWDHAGGNEEFARAVSGVSVVGCEADAARIPALTHGVSENDTLEIGTLRVEVLFTPCHTRGHVLYVVRDTAAPEEPAAIFTGDTLFVGGCGRFFEGSADDMLAAMDKIGALPGSTRVFCGHEYTMKNLAFAQTIEPENADLAAKADACAATLRQGGHTVPSTIADELRINPFMRTRVRAVMQAVGKSDPSSTMAEIRRRKDAF